MRREYLFGIFCLLFGTLTIFSQTAVFNVPSTDVIAEKTFYSEVFFSTHFDKPENGGFRTLGYRMIYGVRKDIEVGANFYYTRSGNFSLKELQTNTKYKVYKNEKYGITLVAGLQVCLPLKNTAELKPSAMFYSSVSKTVAPTKGTRLTGGYYGITGSKNSINSKNGVIAGVEQPISNRVTFLADWYSGKNRFSYSSAALRFYVTKKQVLYAGYNFGNFGKSNNSFSLSYGIFY